MFGEENPEQYSAEVILACRLVNASWRLNELKRKARAGRPYSKTDLLSAGWHLDDLKLKAISMGFIPTELKPIRKKAKVEYARPHLSTAIKALTDIKDDDLVMATASAINSIVKAAQSSSNIKAVKPHLVREVLAEIYRIAGPLCDALNGTFPKDHIVVGLSIVTELLTVTDDFHSERLLYAALLGAELKAASIRAALMRRSDEIFPPNEVGSSRSIFIARPTLAPSVQ